MIISRRSLPKGVEPWPTEDPWLFAVHHEDLYPEGIHMKPDPKLLRGRNIGSDFSGNGTGWRMYHGETMPGFPVHPHRGFETVSIITRGYVDHHDNTGAYGRLGPGDVQWMTAGRGIQHCEMFPLLNSEAGSNNTTDFFQLWLNLPRESKMVEPYFSIMWGEEVPVVYGSSQRTTARIIAGSWDDETKALPPNKESYASQRDSAIQAFVMEIAPGDALTVPPYAATSGEEGDSHSVVRTIYYFSLDSELTYREAGHAEAIPLPPREAIRFDCTQSIPFHVPVHSKKAARILLLQGRSIREPVAQHGPFVMNTREEIHAAFTEYRATQFGGWPYDRPDPVLPHDAGRVAVFPNGTIIRPPNKQE